MTYTHNPPRYKTYVYYRCCSDIVSLSLSLKLKVLLNVFVATFTIRFIHAVVVHNKNETITLQRYLVYLWPVASTYDLYLFLNL